MGRQRVVKEQQKATKEIDASYPTPMRAPNCKVILRERSGMGISS